MSDSFGNISDFVRSLGIPSMKKLLDTGAISDINIRQDGFFDWNALEYQTACRPGEIEGMEFLLAHKPPALPNLQNRNGRTALHLAAYSGDRAFG